MHVGSGWKLLDRSLCCFEFVPKRHHSYTYVVGLLDGMLLVSTFRFCRRCFWAKIIVK